MPSLTGPLGSGLGGDVSPATPITAILAQPRDWAIDPVTSEMVLVSGDMQLVSGAPSIAQDVQMTFRMYLGEWYDDTSKGIDYFGKVFSKQATDDQRRAVFRNAAQGVLGISAVTALKLQFNSRARSLAVSLSATGDIGQLNVATQVNQ